MAPVGAKARPGCSADAFGAMEVGSAQFELDYNTC